MLEAEQERIEVIERARPAVVAVFARGGQGGGSAVLISPDGYALTNYHVTSSAGDYMQCGLPDGNLYDAIIVGTDPTGDVALIRLLGRDDFPAAAIGDSDLVQAGDWCFAMGNPFLLATDFQPTVTAGIVSGVHRYQYPAGTVLEYTDCIQTDASINPGNSGGPLFNAAGELIGINGRISAETRGRINSGAGYAISINQIMNFIDHLRGGRVVDHASLGALVGTDADGRVVVTEVLEQSDAYRRGLREGDEIVEFGGRTIRSVNQFKNVLGIYPEGWTVPLSYRRDNRKYDVYVRLRRLHHEGELERGRGGPERPGRGQPQIEPPAGPEMPEHVAAMFERRRGFANYHFNRVEQQRLLGAIQGMGDFGSLDGTWSLAGEGAGGGPVEMHIADDAAALETRVDLYAAELIDEGVLPTDPPGSGGLLLAMHEWRTMLVRGREGFDDLYYAGSELLEGRGPRVDVLVTRRGGVETHWYFRRRDERLQDANGVPPVALVGLAVFNVSEAVSTADVDACIVRFDEYVSDGDRLWPSRWTIRHAEQTFAVYRFETFPPQSPAPPEQEEQP